MSEPILAVRDLTISYETDYGPLAAVRNASLEVFPGKAVGLVGESGSGKSTIAAAILDLLGSGGSLDHGAILFKGEDLCRMKKPARRDLLGSQIGTVFQDPFTSLNPSIRVGLQIAEPLIQHRGIPGKEAFARARELLSEMGISRTLDVARAYPHQLSGGMKQRALIAVALACEPALMILDEPTTALDVTIEAQILDLLQDLRERHRLSLLFISHNLAVVRRLCDTVYVLYAGEVVEEGLTSELFRLPSHPYTKGLFASLPQLTERDRNHRLSPIPGSMPSLVRLPSGCIFHPRCPLVETRCKSERQSFVTISESRVSRCWKARDISKIEWPSVDHHAGGATSEVRQPLVEVTGLVKRFALGGFWESLRVRQKKEPGFPIVYKRRALTAVDRVSLAIYPGEVVGLVGESGCGKSTLGRCLLRLIEPTSGSIRFEARDITKLAQSALQPFRRAAQIIFQNPDSSLNPRMTVGEIIARPLALFRIAAGRSINRKVGELLELVRLSPSYVRRYPHQLSGGEKQRVGIARALASEPRFIVCDEAVSALDVSVQAAILNLLADLRDQLGLAILFISHDLSVVAHLADRIAVMYQGSICEIGPTDEILKPPYHPYTQALLSAIPQVVLAKAASERIRLPGSVTESIESGPQCHFHLRCPMKIGAICESVDPPMIEVSKRHRIVCHHELATLRQLHSILPASYTQTADP